jgi:hypothetical protein
VKVKYQSSLFSNHCLLSQNPLSLNDMLEHSILVPISTVLVRISTVLVRISTVLVPISTVLVRISTIFATNSFPTKKRFSNCGLFVVKIKVVEWRGEKKTLTKTKTIAIDKSDERLFPKNSEAKKREPTILKSHKKVKKKKNESTEIQN